MRLANIPIISLIHTLPIFNIISFGSYSGGLIIFGFSIAAAFGINYVSKEKISKKTITCVALISVLIIGVLLIPVIAEFSSEQHLSEFIEKSDIQKYIIFQIGQAIYFLVMACIISIILIKKRDLIIILPSFVFLELSLYLPLGLHPISMVYKFILISVSMLILLLIIKFVRIDSIKEKKIFWTSIFFIIICVSIGSWAISEKSDFGMPTRFDSYEDNEITEFLQNNLVHQRMFSFENSLKPNLSAGFDISSIGNFSSFGVNDYYTFTQKFIDDEHSPLGLGSTTWSNLYGPEKSIDKLLENKKYFDFLGVKYIITQGYDLNSISYGFSGLAENHIILDSQEQKIEQSFISTVDSIDSLGIFLFGLNFEENDELILTLNTVPYSEENHRISKISKITNSATNNFKIFPPIKNSLDDKFQFSLQYPDANEEKYIVFYFDEKSPSFSNIEFFINGKKDNNKILPFIITPVEKKYPIVFNFHDIFINENLDAFPRSYLVHDFVTVPKNTSQNFLTQNSNFDLKNSVILESFLSEYELNNLKSISHNLDIAKIIEFNENNIKIQTFSENDSILILTDVYYPGWEVFVDGKQSEILRANGLVRAVVLEEGNHIVEFNYIPKSFWTGVVISVVTIMGLVGVYIYSKKYYKISEPN
jgi:hypothetical protein